MEQPCEVQTKSKRIPLFLSGAVIGAALGVLLAPDSGKETRRKLVDWLKERRMKGKEAMIARKEQVLAAVDAGKRAYKEAEKRPLGV